MNMVVMFFRKTVLLALVAALAMLGVASLPLASASAAGEYDPPIPQGPISNERLERVWARQLRIYNRMGRVDDFVAKLRRLTNRAKDNGKDVSAVQAALDVFKDAQSIYESTKGIVNSHQGFDNQGKVTDPEKAKDTVKATREKLKEIRDAMNGTGKALREAIKAFREANPRRPQSTSP